MEIKTSWWFQPSEKILVNLDYSPKDQAKNEKYLKPPPRKTEKADQPPPTFMGIPPRCDRPQDIRPFFQAFFLGKPKINSPVEKPLLAGGHWGGAPVDSNQKFCSFARASIKIRRFGKQYC